MPSSGDILSHTVPREKRSINSRKKSTLSRGGQKGHPAHLSALSDADQINTVTVKKAPAGAEAVKMIKEIFCTIEHRKLIMSCRTGS